MIRTGNLESVRGDFQYVVNHSTPDFILLPEIYTRLGEVELLLARPKQANEAFARARQLKPDYWPAYSRWADFLIGSGKRAEAKEMVKSGLEYSPTAKGLLAQYKLLGGKPSEIVPKAIPSAHDSEAEETKPDAPQEAKGGAAPTTETTKPDDSSK
jgi:tetratricopeptide (TPR) repeat protein